MKHLRVAMIAPPWLPIPPNGYGGIENVLAVLVPSLIKLGVSVELFTVGESTIVASKNHWLYKTGQYSYLHQPHYDMFPTAAAHMLFALNTINQDNKFDIIHSHTSYIGPTMLAYANNTLPPTLHTLHGPSFTNSAGKPDNLPIWNQLGTSKRFYYAGISHNMMRNTPKTIKHQVLSPVYNGVDITQFPFINKKEDYFITLARFHPDKGQYHAIKACLKDNYKLKMAGVVGDITSPKQVMMELANPLSSYRALIDFRYFSDYIFPYLNDQIEYVGDLSGQKKLNFISHAKALLFPIQWEEPFGMAPIEALACGTPVIAMARGALPEIIQHGFNGFLANNDREFNYYMKRVGDIDPSNCRISVEKKFSAEIMAKKYLKTYQKIIKMSFNSL